MPGGRIEIRWRLAGGDGRPLLRIDWVEKAGRWSPSRKRRGFGSRLIEGSIAAELGGSARLAFERAGVRCEIVIPLEAAIIHEPSGLPEH